MADISPLHKKDLKSAKNNYRPVSILSNISKLYERIMFKQMSEYFENSFSLNINVDLGKVLVLSTV